MSQVDGKVIISQNAIKNNHNLMFKNMFILDICKTIKHLSVVCKDMSYQGCRGAVTHLQDRCWQQDGVFVLSITGQRIVD